MTVTIKNQYYKLVTLTGDNSQSISDLLSFFCICVYTDSELRASDVTFIISFNAKKKKERKKQ